MEYRTLTQKDVPAMLALCRSNPQYYEYLKETPTAQGMQSGILEPLPPGKTAQDKHVIGFFDGGRLLAMMDLITDYPAPACAFIGLFMVDAAEQGRGLGRSIIAKVLDGLRSAGFRRVRLCRIRGNPQPEHFWALCGFEPVGLEIPQERYTLIVLERQL